MSDQPRTAIYESDLRLVLQAINELRIIEEHMEDAFFQGRLTLHNRNGYVIGDIATDDDQWTFSPDEYGSQEGL